MTLLKKLQYQVYNRLYPIVSQTIPSSPIPGRSVTLKSSHSAQSLLLPHSPHGHRKPGLTHSLSDASISSLPDLNTNETACKLDTEESPIPVPPDRENSFEDLEQFLTQHDWALGSSVDEMVSDTTFDSTHGDFESHVHDLEERALKEHLKVIVKDIHNSIGKNLFLFCASDVFASVHIVVSSQVTLTLLCSDRLLSLCLLSFECLNTASAKDQCVACIEEVFFTPLWSPLLELFRYYIL